MADSKAGYIVFYFIFVALTIAIVPYFSADFINYQGSLPSDTSVPSINLLDPFGFVTDIWNRFTIFLSMSTTNPIVTVLLGAMVVGFGWILFEMLRGN